MRISITFFLALLFSGYALADDLTLPNTFAAGTPARAAEVNGNFTAVEASVDDNAADITTNAGDIASNTASVQNNATAIASNETAIQANATAIDVLASGGGLQVYSDGNSIGRLVTIFGSSTAFIQSDMGYMFEGEISGGGYIVERTVYYSGTGCGGTAYVQLQGYEWAGNTTGMVVRASRSGVPVATDVHYVARGSTGVQFTVESNFNNGVCNDESTLIFGFEAFPNDEAITGVPSLRPSLNFYIGMP